MNRGRVYWGIAKVRPNTAWHHLGDVCTLMPKGSPFPLNAVKQLLQEHQIGFESQPTRDFFIKLQAEIPDALLMYYTEGLAHRLELYGTQVEDRFGVEDIL